MIAIAILPLMLMQSLAQAPPAAKVEGQILNALTGEPLKKASVRLQPKFSRSPDGSQPTAYTMTTDAGGKFVIEGIGPGTYILSVTRTGFVAGSYGSKSPGMNPTPLKLDSGQSLKGIDVKLTPQAMVFGRVVDEDGDALPSARITTWRWGFENGKKQLQQRGFAQSQADGTFVIGGLNAGSYFLSADVQANGPGFGGEEQSARNLGQGHESYVTSYFPSAVDADAAAPLDLAAGSEMRGVEIRMRKSHVYEVRGTVVNSSGVSLRDEYLQLMLQRKGVEDVFRFDQSRVAQVPPYTLKFQFKNVYPGTYVVRTQWATVTTRNADGDVVGQRQLTGRMEITVGDRDLDNLTFAVTAGADITGQFIMEGPVQPPQQPGAASNDRKPTVSLSPAQGPNMGNTSAQARDDGSFKIKGIDQDVYNVNVNGIPDTAYVKSISVGGTDITGKTLDLTSGSGGDLKIVVSANGADASGVVRNADGQAVPGARIQVVNDNKKVVKNAASDQSGNFKVSGLAPGSYQVFVWESTGEGVIVDPDFRKAFETKAATIKVSEKSHESVDAKLISAAEMEVELAKLR